MCLGLCLKGCVRLLYVLLLPFPLHSCFLVLFHQALRQFALWHMRKVFLNILEYLVLNISPSTSQPKQSLCSYCSSCSLQYRTESCIKCPAQNKLEASP